MFGSLFIAFGDLILGAGSGLVPSLLIILIFVILTR